MYYLFFLRIGGIVGLFPILFCIIFTGAVFIKPINVNPTSARIHPIPNKNKINKVMIIFIATSPSQF